MQIDAAVLRAADAPFAIERLDLADPGPGEILVRIAGTGMCHTDQMGRIPGDLVAKPVVLGHEGAGVVEAVGPGVAGVTEGDHVVMSFDSCGTCADCRDGHPGFCPQMVAHNMLAAPLDGVARLTDGTGSAVHNRWFGQSSFATHALGTARNVVPVTRDLPPDALAKLGQRVEEDIRSAGSAEIPSHEIGLAILGPLGELDEVAYLRFASVYRSFESLDDFARESETLRNGGSSGEPGRSR